MQTEFLYLFCLKEKADCLVKTLSADNYQLMMDIQTLEGQYASLNAQLDDTRQIITDRQVCFFHASPNYLYQVQSKRI